MADATAVTLCSMMYLAHCFLTKTAMYIAHIWAKAGVADLTKPGLNLQKMISAHHIAHIYPLVVWPQ